MNDNGIIPGYTLRRSSRRRTIEIQVRPDNVRVLAPTTVPKSRIDQFVVEKAEWIRVRQRELQSRLPVAPAPVVLEQGSQLLWMGECLTLDVARGQKTEVAVIAGTVQLTLSCRIRKARTDAIKEQLECWYREQAQRHFESRVAFWSDQMKLLPSAIVVRSYRRKWGCCNSRGVISFNWLLMMAPLQIIDYVIVHELSHLKQLNHSPAFWRVVAHYYPDYRNAKKWLNAQGGHLQWPPVANPSTLIQAAPDSATKV